MKVGEGGMVVHTLVQFVKIVANLLPLNYRIEQPTSCLR